METYPQRRVCTGKNINQKKPQVTGDLHLSHGFWSFFVCLFGWFDFWIFETGFLCVTLAALELTLQTTLALNSEILLPLRHHAWLLVLLPSPVVVGIFQKGECGGGASTCVWLVMLKFQDVSQWQLEITTRRVGQLFFFLMLPLTLTNYCLTPA